MRQSALANSIAGADRPVLQNAIERWLQDDDASRLRALAALARQRSTAARLLLARIEATDLAAIGPLLERGEVEAIEHLAKKSRCLAQAAAGIALR